MAEDTKSFWSTLPGIITAIAALISAIGGILLLRSKSSSNEPIPKEQHAAAPADPAPSATARVVGTWAFIFKSDFSGVQKGNLTIIADENAGPNNIQGDMQSVTNDYNPAAGHIKGTLINNELDFYRETGVPNVLQYFKLTYFSPNKISGTFYNGDQGNPHYKDNGTFELSR